MKTLSSTRPTKSTLNNALTWFILGFALIFSSTLNAQNAKIGFSVKTECLYAQATAYSYDTSCQSLSWREGGSTTVLGYGPVFKTKYSQAGGYTLCLKVVDNCKKWDTLICYQFKVTDCPCDTQKISLKTVYDTTTCGKVKFSTPGAINTSTSKKYSYAWDFSDGTTSTSGDPAHTFTANGTYKTCVTIKWVLSGTNTYCSRTLCESIYIKCYTTKDTTTKDTTNTGGGKDTTNTKDTTGGGKDTTNYSKCNWSKFYFYMSPLNNSCNRYLIKMVNADSCVSTMIKVSQNDSALILQKGSSLEYTFPKDGTYTVCIKGMDNCNNCDTVICKSITIKCSSTSKCNWKSRGLKFNAVKNTSMCGKVVFEATNLNDTCVKYKIAMNGVVLAEKRAYTHYFTKNGNYKVGLMAYDKCKGCDTTIWTEVGIDCFPKDSTNGGNDTTNGKDTTQVKTCDWSKFDFTYTQSKSNCKRYVIKANTPDSCVTYKMKVVSGNTAIYLETGSVHEYTFPANGYYNVCMWGYNNCYKCDTWVCKTVYIKCESASSSNLAEQKFVVSPNPAKDLFVIKTADANLNSSIQVVATDMMGREVLNINTATNQSISTVHLSEGMYWIRVKSNTGAQSMKLQIIR